MAECPAENNVIQETNSSRPVLYTVSKDVTLFFLFIHNFTIHLQVHDYLSFSLNNLNQSPEPLSLLVLRCFMVSDGHDNTQNKKSDDIVGIYLHFF